jgi:hypothetical protein
MVSEEVGGAPLSPKIVEEVGNEPRLLETVEVAGDASQTQGQSVDFVCP